MLILGLAYVALSLIFWPWHKRQGHPWWMALSFMLTGLGWTHLALLTSLPASDYYGSCTVVGWKYMAD